MKAADLLDRGAQGRATTRRRASPPTSTSSRSRCPAQLRPLLHHPSATVRYWGVTLLARHKQTPGLEQELDRAHARHGAARAARRDCEPRPRERLDRGDRRAADVVRRRLVRPRPRRARDRRGRGSGSRPEIAPLLADREWWVRTAAKDALQRMGSGGVADARARTSITPTSSRGTAPPRSCRTSASSTASSCSRPRPRVRARRRSTCCRKIASAGGSRMTEALLDRVDHEDAPSRARPARQPRARNGGSRAVTLDSPLAIADRLRGRLPALRLRHRRSRAARLDARRRDRRAALRYRGRARRRPGQLPVHDPGERHPAGEGRRRPGWCRRAPAPAALPGIRGHHRQRRHAGPTRRAARALRAERVRGVLPPHARRRAVSAASSAAARTSGCSSWIARPQPRRRAQLRREPVALPLRVLRRRAGPLRARSLLEAMHAAIEDPGHHRRGVHVARPVRDRRKRQPATAGLAARHAAASFGAARPAVAAPAAAPASRV